MRVSKLAIGLGALALTVAGCGGSTRSASSTRASSAPVASPAVALPSGTTSERSSAGAHPPPGQGHRRGAATREGSAAGGRVTASGGAATGSGAGGRVAPSPAPREGPHTQALTVIEVAHITGHRGAIVLERGTVTGTPIGAGTVSMEAHLAASGALVYFTVQGPAGSVTGVARVRLQIHGGVVSYAGTAALTRGTGGYRGVRAPRLAVAGSGDVAGTHTVFRITGVQYT